MPNTLKVSPIEMLKQTHQTHIPYEIFAMKFKFKRKLAKQVHYFLSIKVNQTNERIYIYQIKYTNDVLKIF